MDNQTAYKEAQARRDAFSQMIKNLTLFDKVNAVQFAYARFKPSGLGDYYNLYWKSEDSPTGVYLVGGCTPEQWEEVSQLTGKKHNYVSPTEDRRTAK